MGDLVSSSFEARANALAPQDDALSYRAKASSTNRAAASAPASLPNRAITCTPTGNPPSAMIAGTLTQETPIRVQSRLNRGSPVEANPFGGAPGAEKVSNMSMSSKMPANAALA